MSNFFTCFSSRFKTLRTEAIENRNENNSCKKTCPQLYNEEINKVYTKFVANFYREKNMKLLLQTFRTINQANTQTLFVLMVIIEN